MPEIEIDSQHVHYTIGRWVLMTHIFKLLLSVSFQIYYIYAYTLIPEVLIHESLSICLLIYIVADCLIPIHYIVEFVYVCYHYGEVTTPAIWKSITPIHRRPLIYLKWLLLITFGFGCYFMGQFIPIDGNHCGIYANYDSNICVAFQIISVFSLIGVIGIGIPILLLSGLAIVVYCWGGWSALKSVFSSNPHVRQVVQLVVDRLPIVTQVSSDQICAICTDETQEDDQWMVLTCNHKFHQTCINPWLANHQTCPLCRRVQYTFSPNTIV